MGPMDDLEGAYRDYGWHVFERARRILGNDEDARDVCQDVFVRLLHAWGKLRERQRVRAWIMRATTNLCIDRLRGRKDHDGGAVAWLSDGAGGEGRLVARDRVQRLLGGLSERDRRICILRHLDGCSLEETATICGVTRKTVSRRLARIERKARLRLGSGRDGS